VDKKFSRGFSESRGKKQATCYSRNLETQIDMTRKEPLHFTLYLKCQE
jgi:hypothetical protein